MFWRLTASEYAASSRDRNRASLRELVETELVPAGLLAYRDGAPGTVLSTDGVVGWSRLPGSERRGRH